MGGGLIGFFVFAGGGWTSLVLLAVFFLLGTLATSWKRKQKTQFGMMQESSGRRRLAQVLANGGVAGILGVLALLFPEQKAVFSLMMAGSLSSALADTLSSELGTLYGKRFYNILNFRREKPGPDGVVSFEGTMIGILGSAVIAALYCTGYGWSEAFLWILWAGAVGNLADSFLGATLERKKMVSNDVVNVLNTALAALFPLLFVTL